MTAVQKSRRRRHKKPALRFDFVTLLYDCGELEEEGRKNVFIFICVLGLFLLDAGRTGFCRFV
jgi:hypothetical protein